MAIIDNVKLLLGISDTSQDELLNLLIENATEYAVSYTRNSKAEELSGCIQRIVVYDYNRMKTEGLNSESYSGVSFSYAADYPESVLKPLRAHRKVVIPS